MTLPVSHRFSADDLSPEPGRYRLVASPACPFSRRVLIARRLLGLTEAIDLSLSYGKGEDGSWALTGPDGAPGVDPALGVASVLELYSRVDGFTPPATVPALVDMTSGLVVSDSSADLLFDLSTSWWDEHRHGAPDLYPLGVRNSTDAWDAWIGSTINMGDARATHSDDPQVASEAAAQVMIGFDVIDTLLARATHMEASREAALTILDGPALSAVVAIGQFLCGNEPTGSDIRLFTTVQQYEYVSRRRYPDGEAPSISFWPALARWFRALEARPGWVDVEERSALGC